MKIGQRETENKPLRFLKAFLKNNYEINGLLVSGLSNSFFNFAQNLKLNSMFGDMMGMMNKLKETQKKVEETKERLNHVLVDEQSSDGKLKVTLTANRTIKSITFDDELLQDKEMLEDYLIMTINKALEKATSINEAELAAVAKDGMPNIPDLDMFK